MKARRTQLENIVDVRSLHSKLYFDRVLDGPSNLACDLFYRHREPHQSWVHMLVRDTYPVHFPLRASCSRTALHVIRPNALAM